MLDMDMDYFQASGGHLSHPEPWGEPYDPGGCLVTSLAVAPAGGDVAAEWPGGGGERGADLPGDVDTAVAVPAGTTLEVTVRAGTDLQEAFLKQLLPARRFFSRPRRGRAQ